MIVIISRKFALPMSIYEHTLFKYEQTIDNDLL